MLLQQWTAIKQWLLRLTKKNNNIWLNSDLFISGLPCMCYRTLRCAIRYQYSSVNTTETGWVFPKHAAVGSQRVWLLKLKPKSDVYAPENSPDITTVGISYNQKWKLEKGLSVTHFDCSCYPRWNVNVISRSPSQLFVFWPRHTVCPRAVKARRHTNCSGRNGTIIYE